MEARSEDELMKLAAEGSHEAFDAIVRRHRLQRFTIRMLGGDAASGADVAVGALIRLWEHRYTYQARGQLGAWLLQTVYRACLRVAAYEWIQATPSTREALLSGDPARIRAIQESDPRCRSLDEALADLIAGGYVNQEAADEARTA